MNDDELNYKKFLNGDMIGFENLVITYKNNLINFILRYIKDIDLAEDIAQDTFVEIYVHKERFRCKTNFKTYLFTIGRNKAIDYIRKYGREITNHEFVNLEIENSFSTTGTASILSIKEDKSIEEQIITEEEKIMVHQGMKELKEDYQIILHLINFEELSYKEAAKIMNKSVPQIKVLIHRARKALEKILEEGGYIYEK